MGAFILHKKNTPYDHSAVEKMMDGKGFPAPQHFDLGQYELFLYPKVLLRETNYVQKTGNSVFVTGSLCYRANDYAGSIQALHADLEAGTFDLAHAQGVFSIIHHSPAGIRIYTDQSGIQNIYHTADGGILSSSFMAVADGIPGKLTLNRMSAAETIATGLQIGPDTTFNEISRYEFSQKPSFEGISWMNEPNDSRKTEPFQGSHKEAVAHQVNLLNAYMNDLKKMADLYGVDSGITGGHDSRLILTLTKDVFKRISFHSHWRKVKDQELACAELVCEKVNLPIKVMEIRHPLDMNDAEANDTFLKGMHYYDGQVRMYCYFYEAYNTFDYRKKVLDTHRIGLNGIGGEQYRNDDHMALPSWNINRWIRYHLIRYDCGDAITSPEFEKDLVRYFHSKISRKLKFGNQRAITKLDLKRYLNEVYIPARMGARNNAENQLSLFFSPYSDARISKQAYRIVPFLGLTFDFEEHMIAHLNPVIASVMSDYGFDFIQGEPLKRRVLHFFKELLPFPVKMRLLEKRYLSRGNALSRSLREKFKVYDEAYKKVESLGLPLNLDRISYQPDLMGVTFSMGYLLNHYNHKIA